MDLADYQGISSGPRTPNRVTTRKVDGGLAAGSRAPAPAPAASSESDTIAQLEKLGELKEKGILSDEEFAAQKAKVLGT